MENPKTLDGIVIDTDFRAWINYELLLQDPRPSDESKMVYIMKMLFPAPPRLTERLMQLISLFYACGRDIDADGDDPAGRGAKPYCFKVDRQRIKAAFLATYGFNPWDRDYWHWWDFRAAFDHILGDQFKALVDIRTTDTSTLKGRAKQKMEQLQQRYRLTTQEDLELEQQSHDLARAYREGNLAEYVKRLNSEGG